MARGLFRKTSFNKMVGAYRSQWKRFWMRLFTFGMYGRKGMGWWRDPKKAWYNWWYHRTSVSIPRMLGYKPSRLSMLGAMLIASVASVFAAPVDATRAGVKAHKIRTERKARSESSGTRSSSTRTDNGNANRTTSGNTRTSYSSVSTTPRSTSSTESKSKITSHSSAAYSAPRTSSTTKPQSTTTSTHKPKAAYTPVAKPIQEEKPKQGVICSSTLYSYEPTQPITPITPPEPEVKEPDENTPKSKPKHNTDHYIRKRMIIAGSSYCDKSVLDRLAMGTYFELVAEPTNPYDKDAVMLVHDGEKIGYIAKQDKLAFVTCLKLKRRVYGVITDISADYGDHKKYEFETWFDSTK